jgi:hypothetical protein
MKSYKKFGPVSITESGEYESIKSMGPLTIKAPDVKAESIKSMGPAVLKSELKAEKISIHGPCSGEGSISVGEFKINGPFKFAGDISIEGIGKINGPCNVAGSFSGNNETLLSINGPLNFESITGFNKVKINGPTTGFSINDVELLFINGKTIVEEINVSGKATISLGRGETVIKNVIGGDIEIGVLNDNNSFFGRLFKGNENKPDVCVAIIDEIHSDGIVELDNVKVKKVVAKELYAGENTEIGEFVETSEKD